MKGKGPYVSSLAMGSSVEADLLGGANVEVLGSLVQFSFGYARQWDIGSAEAIIQVITTLTLGLFALKRVGLEKLLKMIEK